MAEMALENAPRITVLYSSETGTAEDVAYGLFKSIQSRLPTRIHTQIWSMDSYDITQLPSEHMLVFVVSTTGDGEHPNAMRSFWQFLLKKSLSSTSLENTFSAVFGLGDSAYEKYNACARRLAARLRQLGSRELIPLGLGDDSAQMGYTGALNPWTTALLRGIARASSVELVDSSRANVTDLAAIDDEYVVTVVEAPVDDCQSDATAVRLAVDEYTTLFNDSVDHRPHLQESTRKSLASTGKRGTGSGANCGVGAFLSPDPSKCVTSQLFIARVVENSRMTGVEWPQDVRNISLDFTCSLPALHKQEALQGKALKWPLFQAGDVACIHPENPKDLVERMLNLIPNTSSDMVSGGCCKPNCALSHDSFLSIKRTTSSNPKGESQRRSRLGNISCTAQQLFTHHIDLSGMPRRSFFIGLVEFATNEEEREKLEELASAEGASLYYEYCQRERRNYVEVMEEFPSARPPLHKLLELLPILQPRHYSVASSGYNGHNAALVQLCVAVTTARTPYGRERIGLCSSYLANSLPGQEIKMWLRRGTFANPGSKIPLILVGPGTGVAPMRALLQERRFFAECEDTSYGIDLSNTRKRERDPSDILFYGCRKREYDFLYKEEWTALSRGEEHQEQHKDATDFFCDTESASCQAVCVAFSQDGPENLGKTYVTHKLRLHAELVARLFDQGAHVYVAGSANQMPADVRKAFIECLVMHSKSSPSKEEAELKIRLMEKRSQYLVEAWSG